MKAQTVLAKSILMVLILVPLPTEKILVTWKLNGQEMMLKYACLRVFAIVKEVVLYRYWHLHLYLHYDFQSHFRLNSDDFDSLS